MACLPSRLCGFKSHYPHVMDKFSNDKFIFIENLLQLCVKKGKKNLSENLLRNSFFYFSRNHRTMCLSAVILKAFLNLQPAVKLQKKGRRHKPIYLSKRVQAIQASSWILKEVVGNRNKFYRALMIELLAAYNKTSRSIKDRQLLHQSAGSNVYLITRPKFNKKIKK